MRNRWLRWLAPYLLHPRLWHFSRRGVAVGVAVGVFFGFLIPIAQIPMAAGVAVVMRANVPTAVGSTLVTNPFTFAPIYVLAHRVGAAVLGADLPAEDALAMVHRHDERSEAADVGWWENAWGRVTALGKPLLLGLLIFAVSAGFLTYAAIMVGWKVRTVLERRRRLMSRKARG